MVFYLCGVYRRLVLPERKYRGLSGSDEPTRPNENIAILWQSRLIPPGHSPRAEFEVVVRRSFIVHFRTG